MWDPVLLVSGVRAVAVKQPAIRQLISGVRRVSVGTGTGCEGVFPSTACVCVCAHALCYM